ncbi:hypothetical protein JW948_02075 [bacterium]|nr:hypothetical protein [bacterium]
MRTLNALSPGLRKRDPWSSKLIKPVCVLLVGAMSVSVLQAQALNIPYPRLGIFTFSGQTEASVEILKDFDVIAFPPDALMAQRYKAANPDVILLGTSGSMIAYDMGAMPEAWYYHDINGQRISLWEGAWLMNNSILCPRVDLGDGYGPKRFIDHQVLDIQQKIDFLYFDGVFHDFWWSGPGSTAKATGDLDGNGVADMQEWGIDSLRYVWETGLIQFHEMEYQIPGIKYVVVQVGSDGTLWPNFNGACFEDWPTLNGGVWERWRKYFNDTKTNTKLPKIMLFNNGLSHFDRFYPEYPYKNNYRAVRFGLSSCLLTESFYFVDEGNLLAHHGNVHIYDEFEAKGMLGYPRTDMVKIEGKPLAATNYASGVWLRFFDNGVSVVNATGQTQTVTASEIAALDPVGGSRYYRFRGGQDPDFNNGEEVTNGNPLELWGDTHELNWTTVPEVFGDGAMLFRSRTTLITPIVVDNNENNQTSPGSDPVSYSGSWVMDSNGQKFYAFYTGRNYEVFQPDGFAWSQGGSGSSTARYTPGIGLTGEYEVFEWHGYLGSAPGGDLSSNVPAKIVHAGGQADVTINQTANFGKWNSLGTYTFQEGSAGYVEISNNTSGIVISDAVRFVFRSSSAYDVEAPDPPQGVEVK